MNVRQMVLDALEASQLADPSLVAQDLVSGLADDELREVLEHVMPAYVTKLATQQRSHHISDAAEHGPNNASPRWQQVSIFMDRVFTPDGWKMLRDCTRDDLVAAADDRYARAAQLRQSGDRLMALADYLDQKKVGKVGDLPENEVIQVLSQ